MAKKVRLTVGIEARYVESEDAYTSSCAYQPAETFGEYVAEVKQAFLNEQEALGEPEVDKTDPSKDFNSMATYIAKHIAGIRKIPLDLHSTEVIEAGGEIIGSLNGDEWLKIFLAASNRDLFCEYYPNSKKQNWRFNQGSELISEKIVRKTFS